MSFTSRVRVCFAVLILAVPIWCQLAPEAMAQGPSVMESLVSLARPGDIQDTEPRGGEEIERLLLGRPLAPAGKKSAGERGEVRPNQGQKLVRPCGSAHEVDVFFGAGKLIPGFRSVWPLRERLIRLASLNPGAPVVRSNGRLLSDCGQGVVSFVSLAEKVDNPQGLFSSFEIRVNRAKYHVEFLAEKDDGSKTLLFECRAGLGSAEFPTPRGSFYVMRIFDDKPLWIPPPDRDWAWGQAPSRTVYGGHMMPLFSKRPANPGKKTEDSVRDLDLVAPEMEVVDLGFYRIHGTDSPWSVGSAQSHGCVRLLNASVAILADRLKEYVGMGPRGESPNGPYVDLARPVKVVLY